MCAYVVVFFRAKGAGAGTTLRSRFWRGLAVHGRELNDGLQPHTTGQTAWFGGGADGRAEETLVSHISGAVQRDRICGPSGSSLLSRA